MLTETDIQKLVLPIVKPGEKLVCYYSKKYEKMIFMVRKSHKSLKSRKVKKSKGRKV